MGSDRSDLVVCPDCDGEGRLCDYCGCVRECIDRQTEEGCERDYECELCEGSGEITPEELRHEEERVLRYALDGKIPDRLRRGGCGMRHDDVEIDRAAMLSHAAAGQLHERDEILWRASVLGDEISLCPTGHRRVMALFDDGTQRFLAANA